ncbi:MAG TPA: FAD-binding oxidoreductase [Candidatus Paceibacterota bacterium]|nr:FAD-binding oxidoreductase [Candidatus Paceibacterota bacterium]
MDLRSQISGLIKGDAVNDEESLQRFSRDSSIFERKPAVVVYPKDADDVSALAQFAHEEKAAGRNISIAARCAGSDMTGGPLTDSVSLVFTKYMNRLTGIGDDYAVVEPGMYYRDFEKETLAHGGLILPCYPASKGKCALGGMLANNCGGELTLKYGKANAYIREMEVVLSDGSRTTIYPLGMRELAQKESGQTLEGKIYREIHALILNNKEMIERARPTVTKNSAGYYLWDVMDKEKGTFDLTQLVCGSQGTLALITSARLKLARVKENRAMLVIFLSDMEIVPEVVRRVLKFAPESFESYDDHTWKLAVRFIPELIKNMGLFKMLALGLAFIPEVVMALKGGVPKLVLMAEFAEDSMEDAREKVREAESSLGGLHIRTKMAASSAEVEKYWTIRRESFALLRKNPLGLHAAPFIDDIVVHPDDYPRFLPELNKILDEYHLLYTIAGHAGEGNFHIIPLVDLRKPEYRKMILELQPRVYNLVLKYRGSIDGEHNDGIIRTPYLPLMFGEEMCKLFAEVKNIFDPLNILNPGKKVGGTIEDIQKYMIQR